MKKIKNLILLTLCLILSISCSNDSDSFEPEVIEFTGKEIFEGIFFTHGDFINHVPSILNSFSYLELKKLAQDDKINYSIKVAEILNEIEKKNTTYFNSFKKSIQSKNQLQIEESLKSGAELLLKTTLDKYLNEQQKDDLDKVVSKINIEEHKNSDGTINYDSLSLSIANIGSLNQDFFQGQCIFAGIVLVAAAYVVAVHAAAAMTYVYAAWAIERYAAIDTDVTVTNGSINPSNELNSEILINDLYLLNIK
ncbi:MAG: hypothetical protein HKP59_09120 [Lutibacter sp.]|uniref:hypothetical protein n=1 Tax=Lutibacter sp. TaxID=1925666 RepID=UPI00179F2829|nr:hypothetical protein [Lutibacter sp.]MBT8317778.1 hypothetical protein [Lutibacter sp.]NNJ58636.1 hypothetical protein [Lutibacter sp.]